MEQVTILNPNEIRYESTIGCDVHRDNVVCYSLEYQADGSWLQTKEIFRTTPSGLQSFVGWCATRSPKKILMESTGVYWMAPYDALELAGLPVCVVNPAHVKRMDGRKTDVEDANWLAKIAVNGSFTASYIPTYEYRHLRLEERNVTRMTENLTSYKNRETKAFVAAGFNLSIFSDQFGKAAMAAKEAILAGKPAHEIAAFVKSTSSRKLKATKEQMIEAFSGCLTDAIKRTIESLRRVYTTLEKEIAAEKAHLIAKVKSMEGIYFDLLQTIPGISEWSATVILIEIGGTNNFLSHFSNADRFAAWTGLCPGNNESASKRTGNKRRKGNKQLRATFCESAHSAVKTKDTTFRSKYQSLVIRLGTKRSIVAIAHKILNMVFYVLSRKTPYRDPHINYQQKSSERNASRWLKQLMLMENFDLVVTNNTTGEILDSKTVKEAQKKENVNSLKEAVRE